MKKDLRTRLLFVLVLLELILYLILNYRAIEDYSILLYFQYLPAIFITVWWGWLGLIIPVLLFLFYIWSLVFNIPLPIDYFSLIDILFFLFFIMLILIIRNNWTRSNSSLKIEKQRLKTISEITSDYYFSFYLPDGIENIDLNIQLNWNTEKICGYKKEEVNTFFKFLKKLSNEDQDILLKNLEDLKNKKSFTQIFLCTKKNKEKVWLKISFKLIEEKQGFEVFVVIQDVTTEKNIDILKSEFISLVSHQLREPISVINWHTELLLDGNLGKINKEQKEFLEIVYSTNRRMKDLINSFLNFSKLELGKLDFIKEIVNLNCILKEAVRDLDYQIKNKGLHISVNLDKNIPEINFDSRMFYIVINNLITNAIKYTPEKGSINVKSILKGKNILIEVTDTGYGIANQDKTKIFKRMHRGENIQIKKIEGVGIGLYLTKAILNYQDANITFKSKEGKGTTFLITIPIEKNEK